MDIRCSPTGSRWIWWLCERSEEPGVRRGFLGGGADASAAVFQTLHEQMSASVHEISNLIDPVAVAAHSEASQLGHKVSRAASRTGGGDRARSNPLCSSGVSDG